MTAAIDAGSLETRLGHRFARRDLLEAALTHKSVPASPRRGAERLWAGSYERLEFLGDRVLGLVVAEMLLDQFPRETEGALARRHAELVRKETLAGVAAELGLAPHIRLPPIEQKQARANPALLADVCEALIGALHLDAGIGAARGFVERHWRPRMEAAAAPPKDPKTSLQEWAQAKALKLPAYRLVQSAGPPHEPVFTVTVEVEGLDRTTATGGSKRLAETAAAAALLDRIAASGEP
jgi:ribonuclease-3